MSLFYWLDRLYLLRIIIMKKTAMNRIMKITLIISICFFSLLSCSKESEPILIISNYDYSDIKAIFEKNGCTSCHASTINDYNKVISNWIDKSVDAKETKLYNAIRQGGEMNGYISVKTDINAILEWITSGAPEGIVDTSQGGGTDTVYLELPPFENYDASIWPLFNNACIGCHHEQSEIVYNQLFITNAHGAVWIDTTVAYNQTTLYNAIKSGGEMSSYFSPYQRNIVIQWMSYGAINNN